MRFTRYTSHSGPGAFTGESISLDQQNDELIIANILETLNNPIITKLMNEEELAILCQVVKNHVVERANKIINIQDKEQSKQNTTGYSR